MDIKLKPNNRTFQSEITLNASKSESNRVLVMNALGGGNSIIRNLANARDTVTMQRLLSQKDSSVWDVLDAGTTMRFLTAYNAVSDLPRELTGTDRMQNRPIKVLGDALVHLGAGVSYKSKEGYPPILISPLKNQLASELTVPGNISSQYISALLMIAPCLAKGLAIHIEGEIYSRPYIEMTLSLMRHFGVEHTWDGQIINVPAQKYINNEYTVESDWSGASYWYSLAALSDDCNIYLKGLRQNSNQGDQAIVDIMENFGVISQYDEGGVRLSKLGKVTNSVKIDFKSCPDLAQTVIACAAAKGINIKMTGLESLKIKETDRIVAMQNETAKLGGKLTEHDEHNWSFESNPTENKEEVIIETYEDHRMAMAFAPLSLQYDLLIKEREVVNKSYPDFWRDMASVGLKES